MSEANSDLRQSAVSGANPTLIEINSSHLQIYYSATV